jgi:DnaK suppressor protein
MSTKPRTAAPDSSAGRARQRNLQAMLQDRQREMQGVLQRRVRGVFFDGPGGGLDETERAEAVVQEDIEVALIQMKAETLQRVREALVRLDAGEYGYCAECDGEISEKRLRALPFAVRCTACEESQERHAARERQSRSPQSFPLFFAGQPAS